LVIIIKTNIKMNSLKWLIPVGLIGIFIFSMYGWVVGFNNRAVTLKKTLKHLGVMLNLLISEEW
jgi:ABC-type anion transport system duplicated permease subunit